MTADLLLSARKSPHSPEEVGGMSATQLRDALLALDPLNKVRKQTQGDWLPRFILWGIMRSLLE
jgi:hypothetical protein